MRCKKCQGLIVDEYGARRCVNCGYDPDAVIVARPCQFPGCPYIPTHGTICEQHMSMIGKRRHELLGNLKKARQKRWRQEREMEGCE